MPWQLCYMFCLHRALVSFMGDVVKRYGNVRYLFGDENKLPPYGCSFACG